MENQDNSGILITKTSGEKERFDVSKLKRSLENAGAEKDVIEEIADDIEKWLYEGVTTKKIYRHAYKLLRKRSTLGALRYKLKKALMELGPSGYPFEYFIGAVFEKQGYKTEVGKVIEGRCVTHEIDVIATKEGNQHFIECKYANDQERRVSIQVPLYVRSRVDDIMAKREQLPEYKNYTFSGWVVSSSRFSTDSIDYSKCSGLNLLGWDYPKGNGLKDIIERINIFPITLLNHLLKREKQYLMNKGVVTCNQLMDNLKMLDELNLSNKKYSDLVDELENITNYKY
ncbi:MAG: ATP cone domain-containing protein [bacterium]